MREFSYVIILKTQSLYVPLHINALNGKSAVKLQYFNSALIINYLKYLMCSIVNVIYILHNNIDSVPHKY